MYFFTNDNYEYTVLTSNVTVTRWNGDEAYVDNGVIGYYPGDKSKFLQWYTEGGDSPYHSDQTQTNANFNYTLFTSNVTVTRWNGDEAYVDNGVIGYYPGDKPKFLQWYTEGGDSPYNTPTTITRIRTLNPPTSGIKFSTFFVSKAQVPDVSNYLPQITDPTTISDISDYWMGLISHASNNGGFQQSGSNAGMTIVSLQTASDFSNNYVGAHTLQFSGWDFSANDPSFLNMDSEYNSKILYKHTGNRWTDPSTNLMIGLPQNFIPTTSNVNLPVVVLDSSNSQNTIYSYSDASNVFFDLYAVLGNPKLEDVVNGYNKKLDQISGDFFFLNL